MSKTAREWFQELPEDVRDKAIANAEDELLNDNYYSLGKALVQCFIWDNSNERFNYWYSIYNQLTK